jgi:hypothetical protein
VLAAVGIEVKRGRIRHVATRIVGDDRDVIAYLILHRPAFERSKRIAHRNIRRPSHPAIGAVRVKQLGVSVVCSVA